MTSIVIIVLILLISDNQREVAAKEHFCRESILNSITNLYTNHWRKTDGKYYPTVHIITTSSDPNIKQKFVWDAEHDFIGKPYELDRVEAYQTTFTTRIVFPEFSEDFCQQKETDCQQIRRLSQKLVAFFKKTNENTYTFGQIDNEEEHPVKEEELPFNWIPNGSINPKSSAYLWPKGWISVAKPVATYDVLKEELVFISKDDFPHTVINTKSIRADKWSDNWNETQLDGPLIELKWLVTVFKGEDKDQIVSGIFGFENDGKNIYEYNNRKLIKTELTYQQFFGCDKSGLSDIGNLWIYIIVIVIVVLALIPISAAIYWFKKSSKVIKLKKQKKSKTGTSVITDVSTVKTIDSISGKPIERKSNKN